MTAEQIKADREMRIFLEFLQKSKLPIDYDSVESRKPPEPDILCRHNEQGFIAFELVEFCDSQIAEITARISRSGKIEPVFIWTADPSARIICEKLEKKYETEHPIELLCFTAGRLVTPDDGIIRIAQDVIELRGFGMFRRVWFLGEEACQIISEQSN